MNINQVSQNILFYLKEKNLTQVDLAKGLGTSKQVVSKIIKGEKALRMDEVVSIAKYLNVDTDNLIDEKQEVKEDEFLAVDLYRLISDSKTADFILNLVNNLASMDEELLAHGICFDYTEVRKKLQQV